MNTHLRQIGEQGLKYMMGHDDLFPQQTTSAVIANSTKAEDDGSALKGSLCMASNWECSDNPRWYSQKENLLHGSWIMMCVRSITFVNKCRNSTAPRQLSLRD